MSPRISRNAFLGLTLLSVLGIFVVRDQVFSTSGSANRQPTTTSASVTDQTMIPTITATEQPTQTTVAAVDQPGETNGTVDLPATTNTEIRRGTARAIPTARPTRVVRDNDDDDDEDDADVEDDESDDDD